ncbi:MAG: glycoside hydrolase family 75 protein [Akkermansiaceae bacterium]
MASPPEQYEIDGVRARAPQRVCFPWLTIGFFLLSLVLGLLILSPFPEKLRRKLGLAKLPQTKVLQAPKPEVIVREKVVEKEIKVPPPYFQVPANADVAQTAKGFTFRTEVEQTIGGLASIERDLDGSYAAEFSLEMKLPKAAKSLDELQAVNPKLGKILPGLPSLVENAEVSPFHQVLYEHKAERMKARVSQLGELLTKHNYYDCQTMLAMEHPVSKRKVFLIQADMDVVSDGSDGDRLPQMPESITRSTNYQPTTSYGWKKVGTTENPMIPGLKHRIGNANREIGEGATTAERKTWLRNRIKDLEAKIDDLKHRSYLIAEYDPFIVIPVHMLLDRVDAYCPNKGDYCCVIYKNKIYPAIVGDGGPTFKIGEGSLRLAKEINASASPYQRPVSDVSVTYLVFPRSAKEPFGPPDYADWRSRCAQLLEEIGGLGEGYELHEWENTLPR